MATVTITFPDAQQTRIVDALCAAGGWSAESGLTKAAFAKREIAELVKTRVRAWERAKAHEAAVLAATPPSDVDVT